MVYKEMTHPIRISLEDLQVGVKYAVSAVDLDVGVSFYAHLMAIERPDSIEKLWLLRFKNGVVLRVSKNGAPIFHEVVE